MGYDHSRQQVQDTSVNPAVDQAAFRGRKPADHDAYHLQFVADHLYAGAFAVHVVFCAVFFALGLVFLGAFNILSCVLYVVARQLHRAQRLYTAFFLAAFEIVVHATLASIVIGWNSAFSVYILTLLAMLPLLPFLTNRVRAGFAALCAAYLVALFLFDLYVGALREVESRIVDIMQVANVIVAFMFVALIVYLLTRATQRAQARVEQLARTDFLTGLHNRRSMFERLYACRSDSERNGTPFTVIIGDLDDFKMKNDRYGHEVGDEILCAVSEAAGKSLRPVDSMARWGGEEFLFLLPDTNREDAKRVAGRILEVVRNIRVQAQGVDLGTTISLGVAAYEPSEDIKSLIARADRAMYRAKESGKDQLREATRPAAQD